MAKINYGHVFAAAGFSGGHWDIAQGYNAVYTTVAGDLAFSATNKTLTLTSGTWPSSFKVGRVITTDDATNPGGFTILSIDGTNKIITVKETVVDDTPVGVVVLDASADVEIQDVLLSVGNGVLTDNTPHVLTSRGALGGARTLDLSGMEVEASVRGNETLEGRLAYLTIQNTDVSETNSITLSGSTSINGLPNFVITNQGDYMLRYQKDGEWRINVLPRPAEGTATIKRVPFTAADWEAGTNVSQIKIIQDGTPVAGEVGAHGLTIYDTYVVTVYNTDMPKNEIVDVEIQVESNGDIILLKGRGKAAFNGEVVIVGSLD
jgi:hypothetical protein